MARGCDLECDSGIVICVDSTEKEVVGHVHALAVRFSLRGLEHNVRQPQTIATSLPIEEVSGVATLHF